MLLVLYSMSMKTCHSWSALTDERKHEIIDIEKHHDSLEGVDRDVSTKNEEMRPRAQQIYNAQFEELFFNTSVGKCFIVKVSAKQEHKLQTKRRGPMRVVEASHICYLSLKTSIVRMR